MNVYNAYKILAEELKEKGYLCRLDTNHPHPRLWIKSGEEERFTTLSKTANYDEGDLLSMKRQDIKRDILPKLPIPVVEEKEKKLNGEIKTPIEPNFDPRSYPIKVYLTGKGILTVQMSKEVVPENKPYAEIFLTTEGCLGLIFKATPGTLQSKARSENDTAFRFKRTMVPFKFAEKVPTGYKAPQLFAKIRGESLVCLKPLPDEIRIGISSKKTSGSQYCLEDGTELIKMLHDWLDWAEKEGHKPKLTVEKNRLEIDVTFEMVRKL